MSRELLASIMEARVIDPEAIARAWSARARRPFVGADGRLFVVAADHVARGALAAGEERFAMADRGRLLERLVSALANPRVDGVLAAPDLLDDLVLAGALENKLAFGSINRGGLPASAFEIDDRLTGATVESVTRTGLDGAKMLLRIDRDDVASAVALERAAQWVSGLAAARTVAIVEPFFARRVGGRLTNDLRPDAVVESAAISAGLGDTSAYTWLKLPVVKDFERVAATTSLPIVLLGGEVDDDPDSQRRGWAAALALPSVRGLMVGRSMLFPPDGDVDSAVAAAASLLGR